jgi:Xaa-Pro aminopeptidase
MNFYFLEIDQFFNYCRVFAYEQFWKDLSTFSQAWDKVLLPSSFSTNPGSSHRVIEQVKSTKYKIAQFYNIFFSIQQIPKESRFLQPSPIMMLKAVKNIIEIQGMRRAHVRDGTAMCEFMAYFEDKVIFSYYF